MKKLGAAVAVLACVFAAGDASAFEFGTPATEHPFRSAQNFELELRFSPYYPQVDQEPGLTGTPFKDRFGDKARFFFGLEFDWQTVRIPYIGTLGPGLGAGLVTMSRPATTTSGKPSGDDYSLSIYPFYLAAVLRFDSFWHEAGVPLVPYGKLGLAYGLWKASNTGGTSDFNGSKGKGASAGTNIALGIQFALDALDSGASRNMDNEIGINNTYLYAEYQWLTLNGFGSGDALYVGSNSYVLGMSFEF